MSNFQFPQFGMQTPGSTGSIGTIGLSRFRPNRFLTIPGATDFLSQQNNPLLPQPIPSVSRGKQIFGATGQEFPQEPSKLISPQGTNVGLGVESGIQSPQGTIGGFSLPRAKFQVSSELPSLQPLQLTERTANKNNNQQSDNDVISGLKKFKQFVNTVEDIRDPNSLINTVLAQIENPAIGAASNLSSNTQQELGLQKAGEIAPFGAPSVVPEGLTVQQVQNLEGVFGPLSSQEAALLSPSNKAALTTLGSEIKSGAPIGSFSIPSIPSSTGGITEAGLSSFGNIGASLAGEGVGTAADIGASLASEFAPVAATSAIGDLADLIPFAGPVLSFGLGLAQGQNPLEAAANTATFGLFGLAKGLFGGKPSIFDAKRKVTAANAAAGESTFNSSIAAGAKSNNPDVFLKSLSVGNLGNAFNKGRSAISVGLNLPVSIATQLGLPLPEQIPGRTGLDYEFVPSRVPAGFKFAKVIDPQTFRKLLEFGKNDPVTLLNSIEGSGDVAFLDQSSAEALAARNKMNAQNAFVEFLFGQPNTTYSDLVNVIQSGINATNPEFSKLLGVSRDARLADKQNQEAQSAEDTRQANINKFIAAGATSPGAAEQAIESGAVISPGNVDTSPSIQDIQGNRLFNIDNERPLNIEPNPNHPSLVALRNAKTNSILANKKLLDAIEKAKNASIVVPASTTQTTINNSPDIQNQIQSSELSSLNSLNNLNNLNNQTQNIQRNELSNIQSLINNNQSSPTRTIFVPKPRTIIGLQELSRLPTLTQLRLLLAQKEREKRLGELPNINRNNG